MEMLIAMAALLLAPVIAFAENEVTLKAGDTLSIMVDDGSDSGLEIKVTALAKTKAQEPIAAVVAEPVYETAYQQVCVNGVCSIQPVRRLVNRTVTAARAVAAVPVNAASAVWYAAPMVGAGGCGCGCPNCNCATQAAAYTTSKQRTVFAPRLLFWRR